MDEDTAFIPLGMVGVSNDAMSDGKRLVPAVRLKYRGTPVAGYPEMGAVTVDLNDISPRLALGEQIDHMEYVPLGMLPKSNTPL